MAYSQQMQQNLCTFGQQPNMQSPPLHKRDRIYSRRHLHVHISKAMSLPTELNDIKHIKTKMETIDKIEKTVNTINTKVNELENLVIKLVKGVIDTEKNYVRCS